MTRTSHILLGTAVAATFSLPLVAVVPGSVFPDIDVIWGFAGKKKWKTSLFTAHRGFTHHVLFPIPFFLSSWLTGNSFLFYFAIGLVVHLVADSLTPSGIPYFRHKDRFTLNICSTGKWTELVTVVVLTAFVISVGVVLKALGLLSSFDLNHLNLGLPSIRQLLTTFL